MAFVGTVVAATGNRHRGLVRVESVWLGPKLPRQVEVESDVQPPPGVDIEDLAIFTAGSRYLFVPENASEPFKFPGCGGPIEYSSDLGRYRPSDAKQIPASPGISDAIQLVWFVALQNLAPLIGAATLIAVAFALTWRRRRRAP